MLFSVFLMDCYLLRFIRGSFRLFWNFASWQFAASDHKAWCGWQASC